MGGGRKVELAKKEEQRVAKDLAANFMTWTSPKRAKKKGRDLDRC